MTLRALWKEDWYRSIFCLCAAPLFPEYIAMILLIPALVFGGRALVREKRPLKYSKTLGFLLVYIVIMLVSILVANHKLNTLLTTGMWLGVLLAYPLILSLITDKDRLRATLQTLLVTTAICGGISVLQYALCSAFSLPHAYLDFWEPLDKLVFSLSPVDVNTGWVGIRTSSTFTNPNLYAQSMTMLLPAGVFCLLTAETRQSRVKTGILLAVAILGVLFTFSRGSYLALAAAAFCLVIFQVRRSRPARWILLMMGVGVVLFLLIPNPFRDRLFTIQLTDIAVNSRLRAWIVGWDAFRERPLLGYGAGTMNAHDMILAAQIKSTPHMHNLVLELLVETGIVGILPFLFTGIRFVSGHIRLWKQNTPSGRLFAITFLSLLVGMMVFGVVDYPLGTAKLLLSFFLTLSLSEVAWDLHAVSPLPTLLPPRK